MLVIFSNLILLYSMDENKIILRCLESTPLVNLLCIQSIFDTASLDLFLLVSSLLYISTTHSHTCSSRLLCRVSGIKIRGFAAWVWSMIVYYVMALFE